MGIAVAGALSQSSEALLSVCFRGQYNVFPAPRNVNSPCGITRKLPPAPRSVK